MIEDEYAVEAGSTHPVRLLRMLDGSLIIGYLIDLNTQWVLVLRPYEVLVNEDEELDITSYEFKPYMDQLAYFDPDTLIPTRFNVNSIVAPLIPAPHMVKNYSAICSMMTTYSGDEETVVNSRLPSREMRH